MQLHRTEVDDAGTATMTEQASLPVPAGGELVLDPLGDHLMLVDLADPLTAGERFDVTLQFATAGDVTVEVEVRDERAVRTTVLAAAVAAGARRVRRRRRRRRPRGCPTSTLAALDAGGPTSTLGRPARAGRRQPVGDVVRAVPRGAAGVPGGRHGPSGRPLRRRRQRQETGDAQAFLDELGITFEQYVDERGELAEALGAAALPVTLVVDADGAITTEHLGPMTADDLEDALGDVAG